MSIAIRCPHCSVSINAPETKAGRTANCPKCGKPIAIPALAAVVAPPTPHPVPASHTVVVERGTGDDRKEQEILKRSPAMFRHRPVWFLVLVMLIIGGGFAATTYPPIGLGAAGIGAFLLLVWWFREKATVLTVTNKRTILRQGLLSKNTREVRHADVRYLEVQQSIGQRLFGIGSLALSSAAQGTEEIFISGIKSPQQVKDTIDGYRP